jgi:hypothetical protein
MEKLKMSKIKVLLEKKTKEKVESVIMLKDKGSKNENKITNDQLYRTTITFEDIAKEELNVEYIDGQFIAQGSELACLRLERVYKNPKAKAMYSPNLKSWVFILKV